MIKKLTQINHASLVPFDPVHFLRLNRRVRQGNAARHGNWKIQVQTTPRRNCNRNTVICSLCSKEFSYHRCSSTLKYQLNAKHLVASSQVRAATALEAGASSQPRRATLDQMFKHKLSKSTCDRLTNSLAKWIVMDCRPVSVVEDRGLLETLQIASSHASYKPPSRSTIVSRIQQLYDQERIPFFVTYSIQFMHRM